MIVSGVCIHMEKQFVTTHMAKIEATQVVILVRIVVGAEEPVSKRCGVRENDGE